MPRDTVREWRINLTSVKRPFQIFFWGWEGVGVGRQSGSWGAPQAELQEVCCGTDHWAQRLLVCTW